jgi:hypothetical protein
MLERLLTRQTGSSILLMAIISPRPHADITLDVPSPAASPVNCTIHGKVEAHSPTLLAL